jgi:hypothetical protein
VLNKQLIEKLKIIGVNGVKSIEDGLISIYNQEGFKATSLFDSKINYTYELSVPLKYFGIAIDKPVQFTYNIKLNGVAVNGSNVQVNSTSHGDIISFTGGDGVNYVLPPMLQALDLASPTDFWGEYTLAKK